MISDALELLKMDSPMAPMSSREGTKVLTKLTTLGRVREAAGQLSELRRGATKLDEAASRV